MHGLGALASSSRLRAPTTSRLPSGVEPPAAWTTARGIQACGPLIRRQARGGASCLRPVPVTPTLPRKHRSRRYRPFCGPGPSAGLDPRGRCPLLMHRMRSPGGTSCFSEAPFDVWSSRPLRTPRGVPSPAPPQPTPLPNQVFGALPKRRQERDRRGQAELPQRPWQGVERPQEGEGALGCAGRKGGLHGDLA